MAKRLHFTRRFPVALTEDAYRGLRGFASRTGLAQDEALTFLLEHLPAVTDTEQMSHRLRQFHAQLAAQKG